MAEKILSKPHLIEGAIIPKGSKIVIKESFNSYVDDNPSNWGEDEVIAYGEKRGYEVYGVIGTNHIDGIVLFRLKPHDMGALASVEVSSHEGIFRYASYNAMIGGLLPYIKVDTQKGLVYFLEPESFDDDTVVFSDEPVKLRYIRTLKNY